MARLNSNFGQPEGNLGRLAGWIMARENVRANRLVVEALGVGPDDRVVEIGCGPGVALADAAGRVSRGLVVGVDPSAVMVAQAKRRCRAAIDAGRAEVRRAPAAALPFADASFTRAFSVNALRHWPSAREGFAEMRRVLRPGARVVVGLRKQRQGAGAILTPTAPPMTRSPRFAPRSETSASAASSRKTTSSAGRHSSPSSVPFPGGRDEGRVHSRSLTGRSRAPSMDRVACRRPPQGTVGVGPVPNRPTPDSFLASADQCVRRPGTRGPGRWRSRHRPPPRRLA